MAKVVIEMIALGLKRIVIFVLNFPSGATCRDELFDIGRRNLVRGNPGVAVQHFALFIGRYQLTPIDVKRVTTITQRDFIDVAIGISLLFFANAAAFAYVSGYRGRMVIAKKIPRRPRAQHPPFHNADCYFCLAHPATCQTPHAPVQSDAPPGEVEVLGK